MFPDFTSAELKTISKTPYDVIDKPTQWISVAQNIRLAARLWRPDILEPVPVVVNYPISTSRWNITS